MNWKLQELHAAIKEQSYGSKIEGLNLYGDDLDIVKLEELTQQELEHLSALVDEFIQE